MQERKMSLLFTNRKYTGKFYSDAADIIKLLDYLAKQVRNTGNDGAAGLFLLNVKKLAIKLLHFSKKQRKDLNSKD